MIYVTAQVYSLAFDTSAWLTEAGGRRWKDARGAASWVLSKLAAAEKLWSLTQPPHVDYSLAMNGADDEDFFMTDNAQE